MYLYVYNKHLGTSPALMLSWGTQDSPVMGHDGAQWLSKGMGLLQGGPTPKWEVSLDTPWTVACHIHQHPS